MIPIFLGLSLVTIVSALCVVGLRNSIYNVLALVICFFSIAGHYLLLKAPFLAIIQVIVYAGAIMVLFLFTLMLMNVSKCVEVKKIGLLQIFSVCLGVSLFAILGVFLIDTADSPILMAGEFVGSIGNLGYLLFTQYELQFELSSVLFLSAVVGVVMLGKSLNKESR